MNSGNIFVHTHAAHLFGVQNYALRVGESNRAWDDERDGEEKHASLGTAIVDFTIAFVIFLGIAGAYGFKLAPAMLLLPLIFLSMIVAAFGLGLVIAALMITYRDFRFVVPYCLQVGFFVTPIVWWEEHVGIMMGGWKIALYLNPIAGPLTTFRNVMTGQSVDWLGWALSFSVGATIAVVGIAYFIRAETRFADIA